MTETERLELVAFRAGYVRGVVAALQYTMVEEHPEHRLKSWALEIGAWGESRFLEEPPPALLSGQEVLQ